ncbi:MAG: HAMP domain-containing sensor histidine kinase [Acidimicrobiales bacterium]
MEQARAHSEAVHNTRNAIAAISGGFRMLARQSTVQQDAWLLDSLRSELQRLHQIMAEPSSAGVVEPFDVRHVITPMVTCYRLAEHPISLEATAGVRALGRAGDTAEVVQNLIHNAIRHANATKIVVSITATESDVVVSVSDNGRGIKAAERDAVFAPGYRGTQTGSIGSGLGLHSCRMMMAAQRGTIAIVDRGGPGTTFELTLPLAPTSTPEVIDLTDSTLASSRER